MKKTIAILSTIAFLASASVVSADHRSSDININTTNSATVSNSVYTKSNTGKNASFGGDASVVVRGRGNDNNDARGGHAGVIDTGNADAFAQVVNDVNYTKVRIDTDCGCKGDITVNTKNNAKVDNKVVTKANTGYNESEGGDATTDVRSWWKKHHKNNGGNDNNDAVGGNTGEIETGNADSTSLLTNLVNTTEVRVTRSSNNVQ